MSVRTSSAAVAAPPLAGVRQVAADYLELTKPKVQSLLLLTTVTTMEVAGDPSVGRILLACVGGYLSAGGAGAVNHWYDRDIDAQMARTANRPIPSVSTATGTGDLRACASSAAASPRSASSGG